MFRLIAAVGVVSLLACAGQPQAGDACSPENSLACDSATVGLECHGGIAREIACRGPAGCVSDGSKASCDVSHAVAGDGCAFAQEGQAQCSAGDVNAALKCTAGTWQSQPCAECRTQAGQVLCTQ